jgi:hypothetical protein
MSDEQKRKMEAAKHMSRTSVCVKQFTLPDPFVKINTDTTNDAEIWWNSTLNKRQVLPSPCTVSRGHRRLCNRSIALRHASTSVCLAD